MRQRNAGISIANQWLERLLREQEVDYDSRFLSSYKRLLIATIIELHNPIYRQQCRQLRDALITCPESFDPLLDMLFVAMVYGVEDPLAKLKAKPAYFFKVKMGAYPEQTDVVDYAGKHTLRLRMTSDMGGKPMLYALLRGLAAWSSSLLYHNAAKPYAQSAQGAVQKRVWISAVTEIKSRAAGLSDDAMSAVMLRSAQAALDKSLSHERLLGHLMAAYAGQATLFDFSRNTPLLIEHFRSCRHWLSQQTDWLKKCHAHIGDAYAVMPEVGVLARMELANGGVYLDYMGLLLQFSEASKSMEACAHERASPAYYTISEVMSTLRFAVPRAVPAAQAVAPVAQEHGAIEVKQVERMLPASRRGAAEAAVELESVVVEPLAP